MTRTLFKKWEFICMILKTKNDWLYVDKKEYFDLIEDLFHKKTMYHDKLIDHMIWVSDKLFKEIFW